MHLRFTKLFVTRATHPSVGPFSVLLLSGKFTGHCLTSMSVCGDIYCEKQGKV